MTRFTPTRLFCEELRAAGVKGRVTVSLETLEDYLAARRRMNGDLTKPDAIGFEIGGVLFALDES